MLRVGIVLFDQFDLIDAGGPYEVFLTASRLAERDGAETPYEVVLVSVDGADVVAYGGMAVTGTVAASEVTQLDVLVVPGLIAVHQARMDSDLLAAIAMLAERSDLVTSVCTGAFLLNDIGLLDGQPATTHWEDVDTLADIGRVSSVNAAVRWVDNGDVITSGGLTSGIHMALHVVARTHSLGLAERTARQLDVVWDSGGRRR